MKGGSRRAPGPVELLAPAGGPAALQAALSAGADAVYVGLERWSARAFAGNFAGDALLAAVDRAHVYGARLHLALNVMLKDDELEPAVATLEAPYAAGLDALVVADLGFAALVCERFPDLELHASTQLDTHSSAQLASLSRLGFARAILARELSLAEIGSLDAHGLELEVFAHGALCYGYSGDCLLASMVGGRSGNRGRCSQSCRMKYTLASGASESPSSRVLSTADLATLPVLPQLIAAGVRSFKIEGRMKDAAYVAVAVSVYREAIDAALADPEAYRVQPQWWSQLEQSFSRGFTNAHLDGTHDRVRAGGRGGHRGLQVGRVEALDDETGAVTVRLAHEVAEGDVVQIYTPWGATEPQRIEAPARAGPPPGRLTLRVRERVALKDRVFRLRSAEADGAAADLVSGRTLARPVAVTGRFSGTAGEPPTLTLATDGDEVTLRGEVPLEVARTAALSEAKVVAAIGSLGGTPYRLERLECALPEGVFLPVAALKELRRRAVAELDARRVARARRDPPRRRRVPVLTPAHAQGPATTPGDGLESLVARPATASAVPQVVLRLLPGEEPIRHDSVACVCLDLDATDEPEAVAAAVDRLRANGFAVRWRTPEILFDTDLEWWQAVAGLHWDAVQARHPAALAATVSDRRPVLIEYPVQGLNAVTASVLAADGVVASPETSLAELTVTASRLRDRARLRDQGRGAHGAGGTGTGMRVEIVAFGREQVLHTRDVLGRREGLVAEGEGGYAALALCDAKGYEFPVLAGDRGSLIFNARVTNLCAHLETLAAAGVDAVHLVQRDMTASERELFRARGPGGLAAATDRERFTTGHLFRGVA